MTVCSSLKSVCIDNFSTMGCFELLTFRHIQKLLLRANSGWLMVILLCLMQVFHPNIDVDGNICLNILREDWKPVLSISSIIYGLQFLFLVRQSLLWQFFYFERKCCSNAVPSSQPARQIEEEQPVVCILCCTSRHANMHGPELL